MPMLQFQCIHNQPLRSALQNSYTCHVSYFNTTTIPGLDFVLAAGGAAAGRRTIQRPAHLTVVSESADPSRWPRGICSSRDVSLAIAAEAAGSGCVFGLKGRCRNGFSATLRSANYSEMAVSAVDMSRSRWSSFSPALASPVPLKLDSIPNDVLVGGISSENSRGDVMRTDRLTVIGHRGCGKNNALSIGDVPGTRLSVRENTIRSFNLAASNGADHVEFDVQVTKDGHPILFHDDLILSEGQASRIRDLTLEEFLSFGPQKDGKTGKNMIRRSDGTLKVWSSTLEDSLCTLKDAFELVNPSLGFNVELKFHETEDTPESELRRAISAVLTDVEKYANGRNLFFSSFHPTAAIILRQQQNIFPVFFLTDGGEKIYVDPRRNSVEAAIDVCIQNGLQGVVTEVLAILKNPQLAVQVKNAGLSLLTYGDMNNVAEALVQQYTLNVDGIIVDCVREIVTASRTLHALLNFVQPNWSQFLHPVPREIKAQ